MYDSSSLPLFSNTSVLHINSHLPLLQMRKLGNKIIPYNQNADRTLYVERRYFVERKRKLDSRILTGLRLAILWLSIPSSRYVHFPRCH